MYEITQQNQHTNINTAQLKWTSDDLYANIKWKTAYRIPFETTKETKIQWFQYKILNRIIPTNYNLKKIGIKNCEICSLCKQHREDIEHLF